MFTRFKCFAYFLLSPTSKNKDRARREFILHVLLLASIVLSALATLSAFVGEIRGTSAKGSSIEVFIICLIFIFGYYLSKRGKSTWVSYTLIIVYLLATTMSGYKWGADFGQGLLTYALIIVMSGILISSQVAFIVAGVISVILFTLIYFQGTHVILVSNSWRNQPANLRDALIYGMTCFVIASVSWLFNYELQKALERARSSEIALKKQKNQLEILVEKRTKELRQLQAEKLAQLYRFAEFGRLTSGLFHDLVNPLSLLELNLDRMNRKSKDMDEKEMQQHLNKTMHSMKRLENFVLAARKQIQNQQIIKNFSIKKEINQVIEVLSYKARKSQVQIIFRGKNDVKINGNPVKFSQCLTNLISNAIDAYEESTKPEKHVVVSLERKERKIEITVQDWGSGIQAENLTKIFEPLFTTKSFEKGTGMGLSICKEIVEKDFNGTIVVKSKESFWTIFTLALPITEE